MVGEDPHVLLIFISSQETQQWGKGASHRVPSRRAGVCLPSVRLEKTLLEYVGKLG